MGSSLLSDLTGVGGSGFGAWHGDAGFQALTHKKSVCVKATWIDPSAHYPPYTEGNLKTLKLILYSRIKTAPIMDTLSRRQDSMERSLAEYWQELEI